MFLMVSGGSGSGKSEYAENVAVTLNNESGKKELIYIATMMAFDEEAKKKIERHRRMRKDKKFITIECFTGLKEVRIPAESTVLLDCMSNLSANELFSEKGAGERTVQEVLMGIDHILTQGRNLIVVTNDIFRDGCDYDAATQKYIKYLGQINEGMAKRAEQVVEVVCGIPIYHKGREVTLCSQ